MKEKKYVPINVNPSRASNKYISIDPDHTGSQKRYVPFTAKRGAPEGIQCDGREFGAFTCSSLDTTEYPEEPDENGVDSHLSSKSPRYVPIQRSTKTAVPGGPYPSMRGIAPAFTEPGLHFVSVAYDAGKGIFQYDDASPSAAWKTTVFGIYVPESLYDTTRTPPSGKFLFIIHGNTNRIRYVRRFFGSDGFQGLIDWAEEHANIVVCPVFDKQFYALDVPSSGSACTHLDPNDVLYRYDLYDCAKNEGWYTQPTTYLEYGKDLITSDPRSDYWLVALFQFLRKSFRRAQVKTSSKFDIYGFSWGAQFVTRFALFHLDVLDAIIVGAPGSATFPLFTEAEYDQILLPHDPFLPESNFDWPFTTDVTNVNGTLYPDIRYANYHNIFMELTTSKKLILISGDSDTACGTIAGGFAHRMWQGELFTGEPPEFWKSCPLDILKNYRRVLKAEYLRRPFIPDYFDRVWPEFDVTIIPVPDAPHNWRHHLNHLLPIWNQLISK
jgi:pimeloyl-ACP methyl ester carboxylesterase